MAATARQGDTLIVERSLGPRPTFTRHTIVKVTSEDDGTYAWYREDNGAGPFGINLADAGVEVERAEP